MPNPISANIANPFAKHENGILRGMLLTGLATAAFGCAPALRQARGPTTETKVDYQAINAPSTKHYELREEESSTIPIPIDHVAPDYPASMMPLRLPLVTVQAKVIVDAEGKVTEVRIAHADDAASHPSAFDDAVRDAVMRWHYTPLRITRWEEVKNSEGNVTDSHAASVEAKPFSLDYAFTFELRDGKPVVGDRQQTGSPAK